MLVPSGIATDHTTREFFNDLMDEEALVSLYDFENRRKIFPDVDGRFQIQRFGIWRKREEAARRPISPFSCTAWRSWTRRSGTSRLSRKDMALLNPNTRTCPVFRSRRDAELTKAVYRRVPILIDKSRKEGGNPWGIKFFTMFHQTNDAELFLDREELIKRGAKQDGNRWKKGKQVFLPLYEAKMVQAYDHRAASVIIESQNWVRQGQTEATSPVGHQNPEFRRATAMVGGGKGG